MNRRAFLNSLLVLAGPPLPPKTTKPLRSPKDQEFVSSLRQSVSVGDPSASFVGTGFSVTRISYNRGTVSLSWSGGSGPYQVQQQNAAGSSWSNIGNATMATTKTFASAARMAFYRVQQQVALLSYTLDALGVHLSWKVPDLA